MRLALTSILLAGLAMPTLAKPPLRDVTEIDDALMQVAIADEIRKTCEGIDARMWRALLTLRGLKAEARDRGYSEDEIEAYVTSKSEKARMRAKAEDWLAGQGVAADDAAALCAFGKAQMRADTGIGRLLK